MKTSTFFFYVFASMMVAGFFLFSCESQQGVEENLMQDRSKAFKKADKRDRVDLAILHEVEMTKDPALNEVPRERLVKAREYMQRRAASQTRAGIIGINWEERGPNNVGGRTRAILLDISDPTNNTVFSGGVAGGLWQTTNFSSASPTWTPVNEFFDNMAITCIVQDTANPQNIYFGTGEGFFNADAVRGAGIWFSSDGGASFSQLASTNNSDFYYVQDLLIDRNGNIYAATRNRGIMRSTNGGVSWTQVLGSSVGFGATNRAADLELGPDGDVYATLGLFSTGSVWKSDFATHGANTGDAGTWVDISPVGSYNRIELAIAPSNANRLYVLCQSSTGNDVSYIGRSDNGGTTWNAITVPGAYGMTVFTRGQAWYDLIAGVDPLNDDRLFIGGIDLLTYDNGTSTWTQIAQWYGFGTYQEVHADQHAIIFDPTSSDTVIFGNDGGIFLSTNGSAPVPTINNRNSGYNVTQFYAAAMHPTAGTDYYLAGAQDNGSHQFSSAGMNSTVEVTGGDGAFVHIDQNEPNIQITSYVYNQYRISTNSFASYTNYNVSSSAGKFINPTDYDSDNNILYCSYNPGEYLRIVNIGGATSDANIGIAAFGSAEVSSVTVSPNTPTTVFFGLDNGDVVRVTNANGSPTGTLILDASVLGAGAYVSSVAVQPGDDNHLLVTYSNYGVNSVYESTNGGASWTNVEGNLPDMPIRWAMFVPNQTDQVLLATELGVWSTDNLDGASTIWDASNDGLANVRVDMLQHRSSDDEIIAASHGRGLYSTDFFATVLVSFDGGDIDAIESGIDGNKAAPDDCVGYIDYTTSVTISKNPSVDADIQIVDPGTSTATLGIDYDISPSSFSFTTGGATTQNISIRIYDDGIVESVEDIDLELQIVNAGLTDATLGSPANKTISITDNDYNPDAVTNYNQVGAGGFVSTGSPFQGAEEDRRIQYLYRVSDLTGYGVSAGAIKGLALNVLAKNSTQPFQNFTIKIGHTSLTTYPASPFEFEATEATVFNGNVSTVLGWNFFEFDEPFIWDGSSNLLVEFCFDNSTATGTDEILVSVISGSNFYSWWDNVGTGSGCSFTNLFNIDDVQPVMRFYDAIETVVEDQLVSTEEYLGPNETVYFYGANGELICRIDNGAHDFGCTTVEVDRSVTSAGGPSADFWYNTLSNSNDLFAKTLSISPTNNSITASYDLTVYFTSTEVTDWEAATGRSLSDAIFVKTDGIVISDVSPGGPNYNSSIDSAVATNGTFGSNYYLSGSFTDGFSGFGFGIPGVPTVVTPVDFLAFDGRYQEGEVLLNWATGSETNNKGFFVERALPGSNFEEIGFVQGFGSSSQAHSYNFADQDLIAGNQTYTYRLRQEDIDGETNYSDQVEVFVPFAGLGISLVYDSYAGESSILFDQAPMEKGKIELYQIDGKRLGVVFEGELDQKRFPLNKKSLSEGVYLVKVSLENGSAIVKKWMFRR